MKALKDTDATTWPEKFTNLYLNFQKNDTAVDKLFFFFLSITTKYIQQLITMLLKIKLMKQDNAGHLFYFILFFFQQTKQKQKHTHIHIQRKR